MKKIPLSKRQFAIVDDVDFKWISQWKWSFANGYAIRKLYGKNKPAKTIWMHRLIKNTPDKLETDHIDGNKLNNRHSNLRICSLSENRRNRILRKDNKSGYKGVSWNNGWMARISVNKKCIYLGYFSNKRAAAKAYDFAALKYHGKFANLNFKR